MARAARPPFSTLRLSLPSLPPCPAGACLRVSAALGEGLLGDAPCMRLITGGSERQCKSACTPVYLRSENRLADRARVQGKGGMYVGFHTYLFLTDTSITYPYLLTQAGRTELSVQGWLVGSKGAGEGTSCKEASMALACAKKEGR